MVVGLAVVPAVRVAGCGVAARGRAPCCGTPAAAPGRAARGTVCGVWCWAAGGCFEDGGEDTSLLVQLLPLLVDAESEEVVPYDDEDDSEDEDTEGGAVVLWLRGDGRTVSTG